MAGVPRSKGCQNCKRRRVKCDEKWPTCSSCRRFNAICPGPTTTVKFVNNTRPPSTDRTGTPGHAVSSSPFSPSADPESGQKGQRSFIKRFVIVSPSPRAAPVAPIDHLSSCLITLLEHGPDGCTFLQKSLIRYIPQRLPYSSPVVVDMVSLFCSVWTDHCHQQPPSQITSQRYDKALQSLQKAVQQLVKKPADRAQSIETLTAITILQKTQPLLSREADPSWGVHAAAIKHMMIEMGPPNMNDRFEVALARENRSLLIRNRMAGGPEIAFLNECPWKEAMYRFGPEDWLTDELRPFGTEDCFQIELQTPRMQDWVTDIIRIRANNPYSGEMRELSGRVIGEMSEHAELLRRAISFTTKELLKRQTMVIKYDLTASVVFLRKSYVFTQASAASIFCTLLSVQVIVLRSLYDFSVLYDETPREALYEEYRGLCVQMWMVLPYIHNLQPVTGLAMLGALQVTFEAAVGEERERIIDVVEHIDSYLLRFKRDRALIAEVMTYISKAVTGRVCVDGHLSFIAT